jgi:hypothetical protein
MGSSSIVRGVVAQLLVIINTDKIRIKIDTYVLVFIVQPPCGLFLQGYTNLLAPPCDASL